MSTLHPKECNKCRKFVPQSSCIHEFEWELREKLAQEIESLKCNYELHEEECIIENAAIQQCADVVRGTNG